MLWRFFNAIQLVVYMGFPSLFQMYLTYFIIRLLKLNQKLELGGEVYHFLYPNVIFPEGPWFFNYINAAIIILIYSGLFIIKYAIKDDKINQLFFDSIFST